jgi:hypothetical protein
MYCCRYPAPAFIGLSLFVHIQIYSEYEIKSFKQNYTLGISVTEFCPPPNYCLIYRSVTYRIVKARGFKSLYSLMHCIYSTGYNERVGEVVTLLTRIGGEGGLGRDIGYTEWGYSWFSLVLPEKCGESTSIGPWPLPSKSFPIHHVFIILPFDVT